MEKPFTAPRITGTEMEWSTLVQMHESSGEGPLDSNTAGQFFRKYISPGLFTIHTSTFYSNGARLYYDIGEHIEYATPEDASFMGTVANEIAGERLLHKILDRAREAGSIHDFSLNKRVVDEYLPGIAWGYHENYLSPAHSLDINEQALALLGIHLATRNIFVGAGSLRRTKNGSRYFLAQKALNLNTDFYDGTTRTKPVVNLRNQPLANSDHWRRVHVTCGDPNMSPWATFTKLGTTSLVLRLIENGENLEHLRVKSLTALARHVAGDLTLSKTVELKNGKKLRPLDIQIQILEAAEKLAKRIDLPEEEKTVIEEWKQACDDASTDPMRLKDRSDWVAKQNLLEAYKDKHGLSIDDPLLFSKDRQWDNISDVGFGRKLRKKRWADWMPPEALIAERILTPPTNTRATIRGQLIGHYAKRKNRDKYSDNAHVDWHKIKIGLKIFDMPNPYMTQHPQAKQLLGKPVA